MIRFAVWAAVSTAEQVATVNKRTGEIELKASLDSQVKRCV